jgi:UPF0716 protein FxsA
MGLGRILFAVFLVVPLIEIACFILIGNAIGLWPTLAGVLITAVIGSLVLRHQGMAVMADMRQQMAQGRVPAKAMADTALIGAGGLMLLLPGYFSDLIGILLLLPPTRELIYAFLRSRLSVVTTTSYTAQRPDDSPRVIDLDDDHWRTR